MYYETLYLSENHPFCFFEVTVSNLSKVKSTQAGSSLFDDDQIPPLFGHKWICFLTPATVSQEHLGRCCKLDKRRPRNTPFDASIKDDLSRSLTD